MTRTLTSALILASAMTLGLAAPSFAADASGTMNAPQAASATSAAPAKTTHRKIKASAKHHKRSVKRAAKSPAKPTSPAL